MLVLIKVPVVVEVVNLLFDNLSTEADLSLMLLLAPLTRLLTARIGNLGRLHRCTRHNLIHRYDYLT